MGVSERLTLAPLLGAVAATIKGHVGSPFHDCFVLQSPLLPGVGSLSPLNVLFRELLPKIFLPTNLRL